MPKQKPMFTPAQVNRIVNAMRAIGIQEWAGYCKTMLMCRTFSEKKSQEVADKMDDGSQCIVGEAYGYCRSYACSTCDHYAGEFCMITDEQQDDDGNYYSAVDPELDKKRFFGLLMGFVKHWQEEHIEKAKNEEKLRRSVKQLLLLEKKGIVKAEY